jgi:quinol monooxygenase YgiN
VADPPAADRTDLSPRRARGARATKSACERPSLPRAAYADGVAATVVAVTRIHGIAGRRAELRELMRTTEARVPAEPGCRLYRFAATLEDADEYMHVQEWASEQAFSDHERSPAFQDYQRGLFGLLARPSDMKVHRALQTVSPEPSAPPDPRAAD